MLILKYGDFADLPSAVVGKNKSFKDNFIVKLQNQMMKFFKVISTLYLTTFLSGCDDGLRFYETYENVDQARVDGAYARGWFPEWFPRDAININEYHDLDTSSQAISFEIAEPDNFQWPELCRPTNTARRTRLKTRLFPTSVHKLDGIRECGKFSAVKDKNGLVHMWR